LILYILPRGRIRTPHFEKEKNNPGGKSFSIFVPLIDVGALASFRLSDDSSKVVPNITLANIISPGLYFYWGFGKCPISVGLGGQFGPQLRSITAADINLSKNYYFRFEFVFYANFYRCQGYRTQIQKIVIER
jgi:hypothetical protein